MAENRPAKSLIRIGFDGPRQDARDRINFGLALRRREARLERREERFGQQGVKQIKLVYDRLVSQYATEVRADAAAKSSRSFAGQHEASVSPALLADLQAQVNLAKRQTAEAANDPDLSQSHAQAEATARHLEQFSRWVELAMLCSPAECKGSPSCSMRSKLGYHTRRRDSCPDLPRCMSVLERDVEFARALVEKAYKGLIDPARPLHVYVAFEFLEGSSTVNGETRLFDHPDIHKFRPPSSIRTSRVAIYLPDPLTAEAAFKIVYIAAHEIGIHATQQIDLRGAPGGDNSTAFSEGLVEEALFAALDRCLPRTPFWEPHVGGSVERHLEHQCGVNPKGGFLHNANDQKEIARGSLLWEKLVALGQAALDTGARKRAPISEVNGGRSSLRHIETGRDWALRLVLALNTLPLNGDERTLLFDRLLFELSGSEYDIRGELATRKTRIEAGAPPSRVVELFKRLNRFVHAPLDARSRDGVATLGR